MLSAAARHMRLGGFPSARQGQLEWRRPCRGRYSGQGFARMVVSHTARQQRERGGEGAHGWVPPHFPAAGWGLVSKPTVVAWVGLLPRWAQDRWATLLPSGVGGLGGGVRRRLGHQAHQSQHGQPGPGATPPTHPAPAPVVPPSGTHILGGLPLQSNGLAIQTGQVRVGRSHDGGCGSHVPSAPRAPPT